MHPEFLAIAFVLGILLGAVLWHFVHANVAQAYAVAQNDIAWLRNQAAKVDGAGQALAAAVTPVPVPLAPPPAV